MRRRLRHGLTMTPSLSRRTPSQQIARKSAAQIQRIAQRAANAVMEYRGDNVGWDAAGKIGIVPGGTAPRAQTHRSIPAPPTLWEPRLQPPGSYQPSPRFLERRPRVLANELRIQSRCSMVWDTIYSAPRRSSRRRAFIFQASIPLALAAASHLHHFVRHPAKRRASAWAASRCRPSSTIIAR